MRTFVLVGLLLAAAPLGRAAGAPAGARSSADEVFAAREMLGRPTGQSVTVRALGTVPLDTFLEWGTRAGSYAEATAPVHFSAGTPIELLAEGLLPDTDYVYRIRYRPEGAAGFLAGEERRFHTARPPGRPFRFAVQADPHLDEASSADVYAQTLANELADRPDFLVDLGDTSMAEKCAISGANRCARPAPPTAESVLARNLLARSFFAQACHSIPLFMALGNHEGEAGWFDDGTANNVSVWDTLARKRLHANPVPDGFYTGNGTESPFVGRRENYYAFEWGDALLVVLDPFFATTRKPSQATDEEMWRWTLGEAQYRWLRRTLETSGARSKLVFVHHLVGGGTPEARGGAAFASLFEWGGRNLDGSWGFEDRRPGWGKPIHQLLVDTGVEVLFHGHDHLYAVEEKDGVVYQEVPQPSLGRYDSAGSAAEYGYPGTLGVDVFPSSGHLRVSVSPAELRVEYVRSVPAGDETGERRNGAVVHSYVVRR